MNIDLKGLKPQVSIGKRKEAIAYAKLYKKDDIKKSTAILNGDLCDLCFLNGQSAGVYLQFDSKNINKICLPFDIVRERTNFVLDITVRGGGLNGQVEATKLAVARALSKISSENRAALKTYGFLTRDSRVKERKKYGLKKARKASQYSKR
jgi:small subunit ribosomal protein S9